VTKSVQVDKSINIKLVKNSIKIYFLKIKKNDSFKILKYLSKHLKLLFRLKMYNVSPF
jgi:hypothetical protein